MRAALLRGGVVFAALLSMAACDSGPEGPGSLIGRATGDALGAVVLQVEGVGIQGFAGRGTTQVYWSGDPGRVNTHRVILIDPQGGDLGFEIIVEDRAMVRGSSGARGSSQSGMPRFAWLSTVAK